MPRSSRRHTAAEAPRGSARGGSKSGCWRFYRSDRGQSLVGQGWVGQMAATQESFWAADAAKGAGVEIRIGLHWRPGYGQTSISAGIGESLRSAGRKPVRRSSRRLIRKAVGTASPTGRRDQRPARAAKPARRRPHRVLSGRRPRRHACLQYTFRRGPQRARHAQESACYCADGLRCGDAAQAMIGLDARSPCPGNS